MRKAKLLGLTVLALFAFGAFAASGAYAVEKEEENNPRILVLEGKAAELEGTLTGKGAEAIQLSGEKTFQVTEESLLLKGCEIITGNEKDTNLCKHVALHLAGYKQGLVACRSENAKGEKDPVETVLELLDLHIAAGKAGTMLRPLLFMRVLGTALEEEVILNCGGEKIQLKGVKNGAENKAGVIACALAPALENLPTTKNLEMLCKVNATTHDEEPPECSILCLDFGTTGLEADLNGKEFKDVAWSLHLEGKLNKDIFIDD
jgi:hypothetical protein